MVLNQCTHSAVASTGGVDVLPRALVADQLGLVPRVERLGQSVVIGIALPPPPEATVSQSARAAPWRIDLYCTPRSEWCTRPVRSAPVRFRC